MALSTREIELVNGDELRLRRIIIIIININLMRKSMAAVSGCPIHLVSISILAQQMKR